MIIFVMADFYYTHYCFMTSESIRRKIEETITGLKKTTAEATKSKEAALKYLIEAGIIEADKPLKKNTKRKK